MDDELAFLRTLQESPADDTARLVYADWLDERGGERDRAKAHFLRVTVRLMGPITRVGWRSARARELRQLAADLPGEWLAVVSRVAVERCGDPGAEPDPAKRPFAEAEFVRLGVRFNFVCDRRWDEMTPTDRPTVRHCATCDKGVHYCDTVDAARMHARAGHCVAVSLGAAREPGDLDVRPGLVVGGAGLV